MAKHDKLRSRRELRNRKRLNDGDSWAKEMMCKLEAKKSKKDGGGWNESTRSTNKCKDG
jgi:hypothetical protein